MSFRRAPDLMVPPNSRFPASSPSTSTNTLDAPVFPSYSPQKLSPVIPAFNTEKPLPPPPPSASPTPMPVLPGYFPDNHDVRSSWIDVGSDSEADADISPITTSTTSFHEQGATDRSVTPSAAEPYTMPNSHRPTSDWSASELYNAPAAVPRPSVHSPLLRSASDGENQLHPEAPSRSFARPSHSMHASDNAHFADASNNFSTRPSTTHSYLASTPPRLSSGDSSTASTRSSAYTSPGSSHHFGLGSDHATSNVHVASGDNDSAVGVGITSDSVVQLLSSEAMSPSASRAPVDHHRYSGSFTSRSRSSSINNSTNPAHEHHVSPRLRHVPSYDVNWQHSVDERDEAGISESDMDDVLEEDEDIATDEDTDDDDRTSAAVVADEGRGLIVRGDGVAIHQLHVQPGTTHMLIGSSTTPNAMPAFLMNSIPQISYTLLALDISANYLGALPPVLALCMNLEELNIASNPLRVLPVFLADLTNLRVLIADATGISTLSDSLADLDKLHTLSIRRNKLHALPSWLCMLPALQHLLVDGNSFHGPWKALVEPLLARSIPMTPLYPPSTPMNPLPSATSLVDTENELTDVEDSDLSSALPSANPTRSGDDDEDHTITHSLVTNGARARDATVNSKPLSRTRTTPSRPFAMNSESRIQSKSVAPTESQLPPEMRKMKSAGDLRMRSQSAAQSPVPGPPHLSPPRPSLAQYGTSRSSSNLLTSPELSNKNPPRPEVPRFSSLGPASMGPAKAERPALRTSVWDSISESDDEPEMAPSSRSHSRTPSATEDYSPPPSREGPPKSRGRHSSGGKEKGTRWGFLKKMSMGKIKQDTPPTRPPSSRRSPSDGTDRFAKSPQINMRISTTGNLDVMGKDSPLLRKQSKDLLKIPNNASTLSPPSSASPSSFLAPPSPTTRSARRRSFLPVESPFTVSVPEAAAFVPGITATNSDEDVEDVTAKFSPLDVAAEMRRQEELARRQREEAMRREEDRAREGYLRALRSVMAYLKDMHDLGLSQMGEIEPDVSGLRSRRATGVDGPRDVSMALSGSTAVDSMNGEQLRNSDTLSGIRNGSSLQTLSVMSGASGESSGSGGSVEERKFKDDKGKRAMIIKEIVLTERTYVNGLQELVDIYIKPGAAPVNILGTSSKDTLIPVAERRVAFGAIDSLYSFHKASFLPALERAAAPLMGPNAKENDVDGSLSIQTARAVGNIFVQHAAFMKMYSTYINNFDNAVQRVKHWSSKVPSTSSSPATLSPNLSSSGVGASLAAVASISGIAVESTSNPSGLPPLSTSQRKRIRQFMKKTRINPRHSQLNLEGYLLLPVQRVPRYRLLLEELLRTTPPLGEYVEDSLDRALSEISSLANNMNEGKRDAESRRKLVQWQARIRGKFPSPLVQPHRRLIMDGPLLLTRVVRKAMVSFEAINAQGDASTVQVDCLAPELTPRPLMGVLCNDLLVLCRDPSEGKEPASHVDLWAVLRMQTLPQPASIVHGNALRLVDNKAILYFDAPSPSDALNWYRAINLHIPASKS